MLEEDDEITGGVEHPLDEAFEEDDDGRGRLPAPRLPQDLQIGDDGRHEQEARSYRKTLQYREEVRGHLRELVTKDLKRSAISRDHDSQRHRIHEVGQGAYEDLQLYAIQLRRLEDQASQVLQGLESKTTRRAYRRRIVQALNDLDDLHDSLTEVRRDSVQQLREPVSADRPESPAIPPVAPPPWLVILAIGSVLGFVVFLAHII